MTPDLCHKALQKHGSVQAAADSLKLSRHQFRRILKKADKPKFDYERWRNRGTTQLPMDKGLVLTAKKDFDLYLASDFHAGNESCYYAGLKQMVDDIRDNPIARAIFEGDLMEITPPGHHDGGRNSDSYIDGQIIRTQNALAPIKHKIDLVIGGNHGKPRLSGVGIDPDLILCATLGVPYSTVPKVTQYITPKGRVKVCNGHGKAVSQNALAEVRKLRTIYPNCQLYSLGHDHSLIAEHDGAMEYDDEGNEHWSPVWLCRSGSFLRYAEYARYGMYAPKATGYLIARIRGGKIVAVDPIKV